MTGSKTTMPVRLATVVMAAVGLLLAASVVLLLPTPAAAQIVEPPIPTPGPGGGSTANLTVFLNTLDVDQSVTFTNTADQSTFTLTWKDSEVSSDYFVDLVVPAGVPFQFGMDPVSFDFTFDCDAALTANQVGISGTLAAGDDAYCEILVPSEDGSNQPVLIGEVAPTVTCLAGNGRIDINILNTTDVTQRYTMKVGALNPRVLTIASGNWSRNPVTGRPDGPIRATVSREGVVLLDEDLIVNCDSASPEVTTPEVQIINACRSGNGFVAWQFANQSADPRSYIISFGNLANRSTTAAAFGASIRGVSGRPDGTFNWSVRVGSEVVATGTVTVACD